MEAPTATDVKKRISLLWETLQCPICLDLMSEPVSTKCDHQFCRFCMLKLLSNTKQNKANCPVCKSKITKRSLQESPGFQRLVSGLQEIILAYENDTGTNYFTGLSKQAQPPHVADIKAQHHNKVSVMDASCAEDDYEEALPKSQSSTTAAQDGFARLMGLKDTSPLTTGLDSGLGEAPPTCDKKMYSPTKVENVPLEPAFIPDEDERTDLQTPSKKKSKKDLEPDKILDQRQKKSLEKVAEWLMNVPSEQSLEMENPEEDGDDSDSRSSTSTIDLGQLHRGTNPTRGRAKALEDQVFGAVYKRERRGKEMVKPAEAALEVARFNLSVENTSEDENRDNKQEEHFIREREKNTGSNVLEGEVEFLEDCRGSLEPTHMSENDENKEDEVPHPVSVIEEQQAETKGKRRTRSALQHVDSDLLKCTQKEPENTEPKRTQKRSRGIKSERAKSARTSKPLVLVAVENGEGGPKIGPRSEEVQVHIENYPSSGDQEVPSGRSTRKSRRLRGFAKEDTGKERSRSSVPEKEHSSKHPKFECETLNKVKSLDYKEQKWQADKNGCIYSQDMEEIENMDSGEKTSSRPEEGSEQTLFEVPNTETLFQAACSVAESTAQPSNTARLLTELEMENEQKNDSEQDTEQLVKSFKATKRKSFHLGSRPDVKRSRSLVQENDQSAGAEENRYVCSVDPSAPKHAEPAAAGKTDNQVLVDSQNMPGSDLISDSHLASLKRKASGLYSGCSAEGGCASASSPLPPNLESKHAGQSSKDSAICFATEKPSQISGSQANFMMEDTQSSTLLQSVKADAAKEPLNAPSSLTPSGLQTSVPGGEMTHSQSSRELSTRRKRTRAQKLDCLSDSSDCAEEEFPCLAKILNETASPGEHATRPPACPSPDCVNSSQASVDLFGTPHECAVNDVASSQFSSEVLVTQQKIEMKKELVRLEKLMALVSEVLHEKEASPAKDILDKTKQKITGSDVDHVLSCGQGEVFNQETFPEEEEQDANASLNDGKGAARPTGSKHSSITELNSRISNTVGLSSAAKTLKSDGSPSDGHEDKENNTPERARSLARMLLVTSGLGPSQQITVKKFAKRIGATVVSQVTPEVTHVVMHTDEQLVCERTLKYFLGIAGRKWVVSFQWISECIKQKKLLNETLFEVRGDVVNGFDHQGPMKARATADNNLLMKGYSICFQGPFTDMTTAEMELMVELCGATVVQDPLLLDGKRTSHQLIVVQSGSESSRSVSGKATVVTRGWLLDSVATYTIQNLKNYRADLRAA